MRDGEVLVNEPLTQARLTLPSADFHAASGSPPVAWRISDEPVPYAEAVAAMEAQAEAIAAGQAPELVWLLEHPPLYTAGTSANDADLVAPGRFPVHRTGGAGSTPITAPASGWPTSCSISTGVAGICAPTWRRWRPGSSQHWTPSTCGRAARGPGRGLGPPPRARRGRRGQGRGDRIRVRRWVSFHGISLNVEPDLSHFSGIVPCGISGHGVTSLVDLGRLVTLPEVDMQLRAAFEAIFGETVRVD